jgi:hypothetical protein
LTKPIQRVAFDDDVRWWNPGENVRRPAVFEMAQLVGDSAGEILHRFANATFLSSVIGRETARVCRYRSTLVGGRLHAAMNPYVLERRGLDWDVVKGGIGGLLASLDFSSRSTASWQDELDELASAGAAPSPQGRNLFQRRWDLTKPAWRRLAGFYPTRRLLNSFVDAAVPLQTVTNLWLNTGGGVVTQLHFDPTDNLLAVVKGMKSFFLFPPSEEANMYRCSNTEFDKGECIDTGEPGWHVSAVDMHVLTNASLLPTKYPKLRAARGLHGQLRAGEVLFIPRGWWHLIASYGKPSLSINTWFSHPTG